MTPARLNLLALRADRVPWRGPDPGRHADPPPTALDRPAMPAPGAAPPPAGIQARTVVPALAASPISRRHLFGLAAGAAGAAGVAASGPIGQVLAGAEYPGFELDVRPGRVAFGLAGQPRWVVDVARFAGAPRLTVRREPTAIAVMLRGARFPGTALAADLDARAWQAPDGWRLGIALPGLAFTAEVPLVDWLAGAATATGPARLAAGWPLGPAHRVDLAGAATATYGLDWTVHLAGDRIGRAVCTGAGAAAAFDVAADRVRVSLPPPGGASLLSRPGTLRTLVALERDDRAWRFTPRWDLPGAARLDWPAERFDVAYAESAEDAAAEPRHALTLETRGGGGAFFPGPGAADAAGRPFALPLARARYAVALDATTTAPAVAFMGWLGDAEPWLRAPGGIAARLADPAGGPALEIIAAPGRPPVLAVAPAIADLALPLPDAGVVVDARLPDGARARFGWPGQAPVGDASAAHGTSSAAARPFSSAAIARAAAATSAGISARAGRAGAPPERPSLTSTSPPTASTAWPRPPRSTSWSCGPTTSSSSGSPSTTSSCAPAPTPAIPRGSWRPRPAGRRGSSCTFPRSTSPSGPRSTRASPCWWRPRRPFPRPSPARAGWRSTCRPPFRPRASPTRSTASWTGASSRPGPARRARCGGRRCRRPRSWSPIA